MLEAPWVIGSHLAEVTPGFVEAVECVANSVGTVVTPAFEALSARHGPASATIYNQATNDLLDLCFDTLTGRGRSAMRTARALYEHCVNGHEIAASEEGRQRYLDHQHVVGQVRAKVVREADFMQGNDRRVFQHEVRKLARSSEREATAALNRYGPGFRRSWSGMNLHEMATKHSLQNGYDFYRVASSTLHGSSGGSVGTTRLGDDGQRIHRTGPALSLCPTAFLYGVEHYEILLDALGLTGDARYGELRGSLRHAKQLWPEFWKTIARIDGEMWPTELPPGTVAVFGAGPHGSGRWFVHDLQRGVVRAALPPSEPIPDGILQAIDNLREQVRFDPGIDGKLYSLAAIGVTVQPEPGAKWMPEAALLAQRPFGVHPTTPPWQWGLPPQERWDITKGGLPPDPPAAPHGDPPT